MKTAKNKTDGKHSFTVTSVPNPNPKYADMAWHWSLDYGGERYECKTPLRGPHEAANLAADKFLTLKHRDRSERQHRNAKRSPVGEV